MRSSIKYLIYLSIIASLIIVIFAYSHHSLSNLEESPNSIRFHQRHRHNVPVEDHLDEESNNNTIAPSSRYAYVTLIHGIDSSFKYRGYLYNVLIMKTAFQGQESKADFIVMLGFASNRDATRGIIKEDLDRLKSLGIKIFFLPRLLDSETVNFGEMALLKITPWSFIQYDRVQFLDGDVMPLANMDCFFNLDLNTFTVGNASPLNSGWYLAIPNMLDYEALKEKAIKRLNSPWDMEMGWGEYLPTSLVSNAGKPFPNWNFNGASLDQGLFTHYFVINNGRVTLLKGGAYTNYNGLNKAPSLVPDILKCCNSRFPNSLFAHFTGKSKPWLNRITAESGPNAKLWGRYLDSLKLPVNTSNIHDSGFKPPLGYFHPNK